MMKKIKFSKMHSLGNDFVVVNGIKQNVDITPAQIRMLGDRHRGIGFDQLLLVQKPRHPEADFYYRIFNADGREVAQCGNGSRCVSLFVRLQKLTTKNNLVIERNKGIIRVERLNKSHFCVDMGAPIFAPEQIPFKAPKLAKKYEIAIGPKVIKCGVVSMGNPHAIIEVPDVIDADVDGIGAAMNLHTRFPEGVNVGFMQVVDPGHVRLRVYERSVGETHACGSNACAAVVMGREWGYLHESVSVRLPGGELNIRWAGCDKPVYMTGDAVWVFDGEV